MSTTSERKREWPAFKLEYQSTTSRGKVADKNVSECVMHSALITL
jgi:hypothetical protein